MQQEILRKLLPLLVTLMTFESSAQSSARPSEETIVALMVQARAENQGRFRPYIVTRDYRLFGKDKVKAKSQIMAEITFTPPHTKKYDIRTTSGTGLGGAIVRRALGNEVDIAKDHSSTEFTPENYVFQFLREDDVGGRRCYVLELRPRREDKNLLRGSIWIDSATYLVHRIQGVPAKSPSWWLRDVHVTLSFGEVEGMWLQTGLDATASVRILGPHTLVSKDVEYQISRLVLASGPTQLSDQPGAQRASPQGKAAKLE